MFKHFILYGLGSAAQSIAGFFILPLLTHRLDVNEFAVYSLSQLVASLFGTIFYLGISSALTRSYYDYDDDKNRLSVVYTGFLITCFGALIQIGIGYLFKNIISVNLFDSDKWGLFVFLSLIASALNILTQYLLLYLRILQKSIIVGFSGLLVLLGNFCFTFVFFEIVDNKIFSPVIANIISQLLLFCLLIYSSKEIIKGHFLKDEFNVLLKFGVPTVFISISVAVIEWSDRLFIKEFLSLEDAGIYNLGYKLASVISIFVITPFVQVWNPIMMESRKKPDSQIIFKQVFKYYFEIGIYAVIVASLILPDLIYTFIPQDSYQKGIEIFPVIMLGVLINGLNNIVTAGLFYSRKINYMTLLSYLIAALNITLNFVLIPKYGYYGAAWASLITYSISPFLNYYVSKRYFSFEINWIRFNLSLLFGLIFVLNFNLFDTHSLIFRLVIKITLLILLAAFYFYSLPTEHRLKAISVFKK